MAIRVIETGGVWEMAVGENRELELGERVPVFADEVTGLLWYEDRPGRIRVGEAAGLNSKPRGGCVFVVIDDGD